MEVESKKRKEEKEKIKSRRGKNKKGIVVINKEQSRFFVDLGPRNKERMKLISILEEANKKDYGDEINFKELVLYSINKITEKDIERLKESSLSEMEKVSRTLNEYNKKSNSNLTLGEYLVKRLNIN
jgi:hypothetical protein